MSLSKIPAGGMLYNGAVFGAGLLGVFLWRKDVLPKYMGIISIGAASFGLCTAIWHILNGKGKKRSNIDFRPIDAFYEEIASQVNKELSQLGNQRGEFEVGGYAVEETEEFAPISYLRSGMELSGIYKKRKEASSQGNYLKTYADSFRLKEASKSETKVDKSISVDPLELPLSEDEDELSTSEMEVKRKLGIILNLRKTNPSPLRDVISESKGQSSQYIAELFKEWETEVEKEMSGLKWTEKGVKLRKILGVGKRKTEKK